MNRRLLEQVKAVARRNREENIGRAADRMTVQIYAAMAIALHRECGFGFERIGRVFKRSQDIWTDFTGTGEDMVRKCEEETGIILKYQLPDNEGVADGEPGYNQGY